MTRITIFLLYDLSILGTTPRFTIAMTHIYDGIILNLLSHFKSQRQTLSQSYLAWAESANRETRLSERSATHTMQLPNKAYSHPSYQLSPAVSDSQYRLRVDALFHTVFAVRILIECDCHGFQASCLILSHWCEAEESPEEP